MIDSQHGRLLRDKLQALRVTVIEEMLAAKDWGAFKQLAGRIQGLDEALRLSEEADRNIYGEG